MSEVPQPVLESKAGEAMKGKHHEFTEPGGELDEVFVAKASVHIERMSDTSFWIGIYPQNRLPTIMLNTGVARGEWFFNLYEDTLNDGKDLTVRRPRRGKAELPRGKPPCSDWLKGYDAAIEKIADCMMLMEGIRVEAVAGSVEDTVRNLVEVIRSGETHCPDCGLVGGVAEMRRHKCP